MIDPIEKVAQESWRLGPTPLEPGGRPRAAGGRFAKHALRVAHAPAPAGQLSSSILFGAVAAGMGLRLRRKLSRSG